MTKKLSLFMATVAIVAFAIPTFASANVGLTEPKGTLIKEGSLVEFTSTNWVTKTSLGNLTCKLVTITAKVTANTKTTVDLSDAGTSTTSECFIGGTKPITFTNITITTIHATTTNKGTIDLHFETDLPNNVVCKFTATAMPFTWVSDTDVISIKEGDLVGTPAACEPGTVNADFTIETDGTNTPVLLT